jgi:hypothetical protein
MADNSIPPLTTAVLLLVFNRPNPTKEVFKAISKAQPERLYIAADGPRIDKLGEHILCEDTRSIVKQVDWPCQVRTLFQEVNLGCKKAVSTAISWFFDNEEEGIILEDDCVPSQSFFYFCQDTLSKYRTTPEVGIVCGSYYHFNKFNHIESLYFTINPYIWGWATWKRVWKGFDVSMSSFSLEEAKSLIWKSYITTPAKQYWFSCLKNAAEGKVDTWDYPFTWHLLLNRYLHVSPTKNLISNIGYGEDATHTKQKVGNYSDMPRHDIDFPLTFPSSIDRNIELDLAFERETFRRGNLVVRLLRKIKKMILNFR